MRNHTLDVPRGVSKMITDVLGKYITPAKTEPESLVIGDLFVFFQEQREQPLQLILDDASAGDA